jgi:hypothetical protein
MVFWVGWWGFFFCLHFLTDLRCAGGACLAVPARGTVCGLEVASARGWHVQWMRDDKHPERVISAEEADQHNALHD